MIVTTQQGQILYDYHQHDNVDPASITKLMTIYLVLDDIDKGKIKLTDEVKFQDDMPKCHAYRD